uniref:Uncharacterized protein n=1 Tax=Heterorhabditis bacteriophora TaxID=37862 RepID=A0A1I7WX69_HETBA
MNRASTLSLHKRRKIKELPTANYTVLASLSNKIMPQSTPVEAPRLGCKTIVWPLWAGHRALRTQIQ